MEDIKQRQILGIALVICKNPETGKYLSVLECNNSWWVPGGRVDAPESFSTGAIRQCQQEAGVDINLKGILRIEQSPSRSFDRLKIVFYAQPKDPKQVPKQVADKQSLKAEYYTLKEIVDLQSKWRGPELYEWANYLEKGGKIHPLSLLVQNQV